VGCAKPSRAPFGGDSPLGRDVGSAYDLGGNVPHIGIVVDRKGASRRYMIEHNIGQGPRIEDVLFNWKITGHYRYYGPAL